MGDEFESEIDKDEIFSSVTPRKFDRHTFLVLWLQHKAAKKMVKSDLYSSFADALLMHREYKEDRAQFQEQSAREIEALVTAVGGVNGTPD